MPPDLPLRKRIGYALGFTPPGDSTASAVEVAVYRASGFLILVGVAIFYPMTNNCEPLERQCLSVRCLHLRRELIRGIALPKRLRIFLRRRGMAHAGEEEWEILLTAEVESFLDGDKSGQWDKWYRTAVPRAERLYDDYLAERKKEMGQ